MDIGYDNWDLWVKKCPDVNLPEWISGKWLEFIPVWENPEYYRYFYDWWEISYEEFCELDRKTFTSFDDILGIPSKILWLLQKPSAEEYDIAWFLKNMKKDWFSELEGAWDLSEAVCTKIEQVWVHVTHIDNFFRIQGWEFMMTETWVAFCSPLGDIIHFTREELIRIHDFRKEHQDSFDELNILDETDAAIEKLFPVMPKIVDENPEISETIMLVCKQWLSVDPNEHPWLQDKLNILRAFLESNWNIVVTSSIIWNSLYHDVKINLYRNEVHHNQYNLVFKYDEIMYLQSFL